jgi:hypothetical protein
VSAALLLRPDDLLRLRPAFNWNGTAGIWLRAWDQSNGKSAGSTADTSASPLLV